MGTSSSTTTKTTMDTQPTLPTHDPATSYLQAKHDPEDIHRRSTAPQRSITPRTYVHTHPPSAPSHRTSSGRPTLSRSHIHAYTPAPTHLHSRTHIFQPTNPHPHSLQTQHNTTVPAPPAHLARTYAPKGENLAAPAVGPGATFKKEGCDAGAGAGAYAYASESERLGKAGGVAEFVMVVG